MVELFYVVLVLLIVTRLMGELAERLGQPALVGEVVAGVLIGSVVLHWSGAFPVLSELTEDPVFAALTDLGIFFLMLQAGLEMRPRDVAEASGPSFFVALGGLVLPLALGLGVGWLLVPESPWRPAQILFLGVALSITAVPVSVKVLMDLGRLEGRAGTMIVSSALFDDVFSLVLLAVLTAVIRTGTIPDAAALAWLAGKVVLFFAVTIPVGRYVLPALGRHAHRAFVPEFGFSFLLLTALAYAVLAEWLEMHFMIGAFLAGLFFERRTIDEEAHTAVTARVSGISTGFLAPVFFASIGLHLDPGSFAEVPRLLVLLVVAGSLGKVLGAGIPARACGLSWRESAAVGVGMNARGAVELVVADVALRAQLFSRPEPVPEVVAGLYSAVVGMAIVTTLLTPVGLKRIFRLA